MEKIIRYLIITLILLLNTVMANGDNRTECDRYRKEIATIDSASVQSYIAQVNKQRAANQVAQQTLRNNHQRNILMTSIVAGGLLDTLHSTAQVLSVDYTGEGIVVETIVDPILYGRIREYITKEIP